jgi:hypothetical protein
MAVRTENKQLVENIVAITPSDSTAVELTSGFHVNASGDIKVDMYQGSTAVTLAVVAGVSYPYRVTRIYNTDTTATGIHALY